MRDQGTSARALANTNDRQAPNTSAGERPRAEAGPGWIRIPSRGSSGQSSSALCRLDRRGFTVPNAAPGAGLEQPGDVLAA